MVSLSVSSRCLDGLPRITVVFLESKREPGSWAGNQKCNHHSTAIIREYHHKEFTFYYVVFEARSDSDIAMRIQRTVLLRVQSTKTPL
jgi:hypothetical protein